MGSPFRGVAGAARRPLVLMHDFLLLHPVGCIPFLPSLPVFFFSRVDGDDAPFALYARQYLVGEPVFR